MRLKTLRKERPAFETEGAVINGNRMDLSRNDLKPTKYRCNTSFAVPTSLNSESSPLIVLSSDQTHEMNIRPRSHQPIIIPTGLSSSNLPSYQAIETTYLKYGIRIRLSPTRTGQQSGRKSVNSLQQHTVFASRNPIRSSSVLHYTTNNLDQHQDSRSFSALQQSSSNDFEQTHTHNVSYAQSSQINEEIHDGYLTPSIIASEHLNSMTPPEKIPIAHDLTSTTTLYDNDPDLAYMSSLLKKPSGDSFLETIRRRSGLRRTFAIHRHPLTSNTLQPQQQQTREKSPTMNRNILTRSATNTVVSTPSSNRIDKDILKHASRIRRKSQSKDYLIKSPRKDTSPIVDSSSKRNSINKPLKSISLEPLELVLSSAQRSASLSAHDLPLIRTPSKPHKNKRTKSAKISTFENENSTNFLSVEPSTYPSILHDESLSLMKTSPIDMTRQSNSFDSGYYERSTSSVDLQSLASSSIIQIPSSIPSARLTNFAAHRSNTNKKVSFYEEPSKIILTTATYV